MAIILMSIAPKGGRRHLATLIIRNFCRLIWLKTLPCSMCRLHAFEKAIDPKKLRVERWNRICVMICIFTNWIMHDKAVDPKKLRGERWNRFWMTIDCVSCLPTQFMFERRLYDTHALVWLFAFGSLFPSNEWSNTRFNSTTLCNSNKEQAINTGWNLRTSFDLRVLGFRFLLNPLSQFLIIGTHQQN